jgi:hypothetical protein
MPDTPTQGAFSALDDGTTMGPPQIGGLALRAEAVLRDMLGCRRAGNFEKPQPA